MHRGEYNQEKHRKMQLADAVGTLPWSLFFTTLTHATAGSVGCKELTAALLSWELLSVDELPKSPLPKVMHPFHP